jgi:dihydroxynaphthoic acid synthetase
VSYTDITYKSADGIATITLNRPDKLNALRTQTVIDLIDAVSEADQDRTVGVIICTGTGKAFSVGGDIEELKTLDRESGRLWNQRLIQLSSKMRETSKPIIASVNGFCIGGGNEFNVFCDLTISSERAIFGQAGPKIGGCPLWGGTQILPRLVGDKKAREIIMLCLQYSAQEALQMGWINRVVPHDELETATREWANIILDRAPQSMQLAKMSINYESDQLYSSLTHGGALLEFVWESEQFKEGVSAFVEKRSPDFRQFRKW